MIVRSRLMQLVGFGAAVALVGCSANGMAPSSGAATLGAPQVHHAPQYMPTVSAAPKTGFTEFPYNGGPVLTSPKAYLILWGYKKYGDPDRVAELLREYLKVQGGSGHNNIYTQYYQTINGETTYISNPRNQLGGVWDDEQHPVPRNPSEAQVAKEALRAAAKFGGDADGSYIVATPHGRNTQGFGVEWCAYHDDVGLGHGSFISYTDLPYIPDAGSNCGADFTQAPKDESRADEGVTIVAGNMYGDSVTDPVPGTGWSYEGAEISDFCSWVDIENDTFRNKSYTMQPMFSNLSDSCVQTY